MFLDKIGFVSCITITERHTIDEQEHRETTGGDKVQILLIFIDFL